MEPQLWTKVQERWADILVLRGQEVHVVTVVADGKGLEHKLTKALQALQSGQDPHTIKPDFHKTLNAPTITKAEVSPDHEMLTLYGGENGSKKLIYSTGGKNADAILQTILALSGKTFQPVEEEIGVVEALVGPVFVGLATAGLAALVYANAGMTAAGKELDFQGSGRTPGGLRLLKDAAQLLGRNGTIAVGVVLLILIVVWAVRSITHRAHRTVWRPAQS